MTMQPVLEQYAKHINRIHRIAFNKHRSLTSEQLRGLAYYTAAAETLQGLMLQPAPAWVGASGKFVRL